MISRTPSSPISLYPSLHSFSLSPSLSCLEISVILYLGTRAHQWPRKSNFLSSRFGMGNVATPRRRGLRRSVPEVTNILPSSSLWHRPPLLLRSASPQRRSPHYCVLETTCCTSFPHFMLWFLPSIVRFLFYSDFAMFYEISWYRGFAQYQRI